MVLAGGVWKESEFIELERYEINASPVKGAEGEGELLRMGGNSRLWRCRFLNSQCVWYQLFGYHLITTTSIKRGQKHHQVCGKQTSTIIRFSHLTDWPIECQIFERGDDLYQIKMNHTLPHLALKCS